LFGRLAAKFSELAEAMGKAVVKAHELLVTEIAACALNRHPYP
jgi:hypothetical protein